MLSHTQRSAAVRAAMVAAATLCIGVLLHLIPSSQVQWHSAIQRLFYLPVIYAGLRLGWRGGLGAALLAGACHFPNIDSTIWISSPPYSPLRYVEVYVLFTLGAVTGLLSDRERKLRRTSGQADDRLARIYEELHGNFDQMKRAERLYALGQLSAGLAHEIRNPLASIAGAGGILARNRGSEQKHTECVAIINKECQRLNRLLTSFLDFARPRRPQFRNIELEPVLDEVIELAGHAANGVPIRLQKRLAPGLPGLDCDPEQIEQILLNLVINAIQAMPDGGDIVLSTRAHDGKAFIEVRDEGLGVSPEQMERLYDPFFTTKENGTGLGLSVAHQMVHLWGGVLSARRNPDRGMTFTIQLPMKSVETVA